MMSSERMGGVSLENLCPPSPELQLGTMSTADMFDKSWECGVEGEAACPESSSPMMCPIPSLLPDNFYDWYSDEVLETNLLKADLEENFEGDMGLLHYTSDVPLDLSLLHDTGSNMSDMSSSSSTITSSSIPPSPGGSTILEDGDTLDELDGWVAVPALSGSLRDMPKSMPMRKANEVQKCNDNDTSQEKVKNETMETNVKCAKSNNSPKRQKKLHRSPLKTTSHLLHNTDKLSESVPVSPQHQSPHSRYKYSAAKENNLAVRKRKLLNFLDSNIKWSELSGSEQWDIGEGLSTLLSKSLGVREKLDVLKLLGCPITSSQLIITSDLNMTASLDDDSLEAVRRYLRVLENENSGIFKKLLKGEHDKLSFKHSVKKMTSKEKKPKDWRVTENEESPSQSLHSISLLPTASLDTDTHHSQSITKKGSRSKKARKKLPQTSHRIKRGELRASGVIPQLCQRSRKDYKQMLKEKRSGLFKEEVVVCVSTNSSNQRHNSLSDDDDDVDILE